MHLDFHLFLRGDTVEATAAGITLDINDSKAVACVLADSLEGCEGAGIHFGFQSLSLFAQTLLVLLGLAYNLLEFLTLLGKDMLLVLEVLLCSGNLGLLRFNLTGKLVDVLFGKVNPSGRLAETFPKKLSDNPSYLYYQGEGDITEYREGVYVGYRYYDKKEMEAAPVPRGRRRSCPPVPPAVRRG